MRSRTTAQFRELFRELPKAVRAEGRKAYKLFKQNPRHPSLHFKRIAGNIHSARITRGYRVVAIVEDDVVIWFWAGSHSNYDKLVQRLRRK